MRSLDVSRRVTIAGHAVIDQVFDLRNQITPRKSLGGPISYSSISLTSLGFPVDVITKVGGDFPKTYSRLLSEKGNVKVGCSLLPEEDTTSFRIERFRQPRRMWLLKKCKDLSIEDFEKISRKVSGTLVVNTVAGEISLELLEKISKRYDHVFVDSQGFVRSFSKGGKVGTKSGVDLASLANVDFLKADEMELFGWTGSSDEDVAVRLLSRHVRYLIATAGGNHVKVFHEGKLKWKAIPPSVRVRDTTGAGDIFLAVFAAYYSSSENIETSLAKASCAASLSLETKGIEKAILNRNEVERRVRTVKILRY